MKRTWLNYISFMIHLLAYQFRIDVWICMFILQKHYTFCHYIIRHINYHWSLMQKRFWVRRRNLCAYKGRRAKWWSTENRPTTGLANWSLCVNVNQRVRYDLSHVPIPRHSHDESTCLRPASTTQVEDRWSCPGNNRQKIGRNRQCWRFTLVLFEISLGAVSQNTKSRDEPSRGNNVGPVSCPNSNSCSSHSSSDQSIHLKAPSS